RLGVNDRVCFLGHRDDAPALVAMADFTLLPSRWEGMPYIVLESMAAARPVVATPVDGARDIVVDGKTGFLAREISTAALAEAVRSLLALSVPQRATMGAAGRERVLSRWTVDRMVDGMIAVYAEALGG